MRSVPRASVRSTTGILQPEFLLLVPFAAVVVRFVPYPRIPRLVRIQRPETSAISRAPACGAAIGCALVCAASRPSVAQSVEFGRQPALDAAGSGRGRAVGGRVAVAVREGVEGGWGEAEAAGAVVGVAGRWGVSLGGVIGLGGRGRGLRYPAAAAEDEEHHDDEDEGAPAVHGRGGGLGALWR